MHCVDLAIKCALTLVYKEKWMLFGYLFSLLLIAKVSFTLDEMNAPEHQVFNAQEIITYLYL